MAERFSEQDNKLWEGHRMILPEMREKAVHTCGECRFLWRSKGKPKAAGVVCKYSALRQPGPKSPRKFQSGKCCGWSEERAWKNFGAGLSGGSGLRPLPAPVIPKPSIPEITIMSDNGRFCPGYPKTAGIPKPCSISV